MLVSVTIDKQEEEGRPKVMINLVETLDKAIADVANGLEISINDTSVVAPLRQILSRDRNGKNKIYIKPDDNNWDIRITLPGGYALYGDVLSQIRALPGISMVKEI